MSVFLKDLNWGCRLRLKTHVRLTLGISRGLYPPDQTEDVTDMGGEQDGTATLISSANFSPFVREFLMSDHYGVNAYDSPSKQAGSGNTIFCGLPE
ncbi:hypothetical protein AB5N19_06000 [Seiridium cardinale]